MKKKLIEVALPLDAINAASAREKSIRHGHPSTLHLWWSRKPLATARAVLFASLVDDPSSHPEEFPTQEAQDAERQRLFRLIEKLVVWENSTNKELFAEAYKEIEKSTGGNPPPVFDPFAGGGTIPLEAQRLGLKTIAADLNPVAVMINKAMIEIPAKFANQPPVNPDAKSLIDATWKGAQGLANDIAYYGKLLKQKAFERIGHLYPKVKIPETGQEATVIAWKWARTVKCPNPACGCEMPLANSFWLSKKKGKEVWLKLSSDNGVHFEVHHGIAPKEVDNGTKKGKKALFCCPFCGDSLVNGDYIDKEAHEGRMKVVPMAVIVENAGRRVYLSPDDAPVNIENIERYYSAHSIEEKIPHEECRGTFASNAQGRHYGFYEFKDYFTHRQLISLATFNELTATIKKEICSHGGTEEYSDAIVLYLSIILNRLADRSSSLCGWDSGYQKIRNTFGRQGISMVWDFAEGNPFSNSTGSFSSMIDWVVEYVFSTSCTTNGIVIKQNASTNSMTQNLVVSTDPPYYDNVCYSDLSDFFYVWQRRVLKNIYPDIFSTMLVPKKEELIATPYRFDGNKQAAKDFFENGMAEVCKQIHNYANDDFPLTIYYAFKQNDMDTDGTASSGWETMLNAIISAGFSITGTWPMRTEMTNRQVAMGTNALASSIVLVCRKRESTAATCTRKNFLRELKSELESSLAHLQASNIAPVDMAQSAIGPGISVYSRYQAVLESDGSPMTVRSALKLINQALDDYFHGQGENIDAESRFAVDLYTQCGFNEIPFGEADVLARARNVAMNRLQDMGMVNAAKGKVHLTDRDELPGKLPSAEVTWNWVQILVRELGAHGIEGCAKLLIDYMGDGEGIKNLAYRLYQIADKKGWAQEGTGYNNLVISWQDIMTRREELKNIGAEAMTLNL